MPAAEVLDLHWSGYAAASDEEWDDFTTAIARSGAQLGAATEARHRVAPRGFGQYRPDLRGAECSIFWDRGRYKPTKGPETDLRGAWQLTDETFYIGRGAERPGVVATFILLDDLVDLYDLLRIAAHMPASVQRGDRFSTNLRRVRAWRAALKGLRAMILELRRDLRPDEVIVSCDWNVDLKRKVWRVVINHGLRGTGVRVKAPTEGTHRDRAIDAHATTMRRARRNGKSLLSRVLKRVKGFDHRGVLAALTRRNHR